MSPATKPRGLIAVMGSTGSGKSSVVNDILDKPEANVEDGLESATAEVGQYVHLHESGMEVRIVDTPGFNDYRTEGTRSDLKILQMIGAFLKTEYDANQKFSGMIFLHNINTAKVDWQTQRRNMTLFKKLCGTESMKNVVVITSFWDELSDMSYGIERENDLKTQDGLLKELYVGGAKFVRWGHFKPGKLPQDPNFLSPKQVVDYLLSLDPVFVEMQKEMAKGAAIADTAAGSSLLEEFERLKRETRESLETMRKEIESIRSADDAHRSHREELKREAEKMQDRLNGWEKDGEDMRMKLSQWEEYRAQIATKEELDALVSRHQEEFGGLQHEVLKLREANEKLRQIDQQRIEELNQTVARLRKEREDLAEECKALRSGNHNQVQGFHASLTDITRTYHRETERLQSLLASQGEDLKQAKLACAQTQKELDANHQLYMKSEAELNKSKQSFKSSQEEVTRSKESYEKLSYQYDALATEHKETLLVSQRLDQELQKANCDKQVLESQNAELEGRLREATSTVDKTVAAANEFRSRLSTEVDDTIASMESDAQALRSEKARYQSDLDQRNEEIAKLRQEVESLRRQPPTPPRFSSSPLYSSYPSPPADDPYGAWNNPTGSPLAIAVPEPSSPPPLPPRPFQGISPSAYSPYSCMPTPVSFPSADIHLDINFGTGLQVPRQPQQQQQWLGAGNRSPVQHQQQGPRNIPGARGGPPQLPPRHPAIKLGSPSPRSQTPLAPQPKPYVAHNIQGRWSSLSVNNPGTN